MEESKQSVSLKVNLKWLCLLLLAVIVVMLALWRPWQSRYASNARTVSATGQTTIKAAPDQFVFTPNYTFTNASKDVALAALTAKQTELVGGLIKLGVGDSAIKADSSGNQDYSYDSAAKTYTYSLNLTVTLSSKDLTQKVQDYLVSSSPTGSVSPSSSFSDNLQKKLESQARGQALSDAKAKAQQAASELGAHLGAVKSIDDSSARSIPIFRPMTLQSSGAAADSALAVQPGQNELPYSITVVYYLK